MHFIISPHARNIHKGCHSNLGFQYLEYILFSQPSVPTLYWEKRKIDRLASKKETEKGWPYVVSTVVLIWHSVCCLDQGKLVALVFVMLSGKICVSLFAFYQSFFTFYQHIRKHTFLSYIIVTICMSPLWSIAISSHLSLSKVHGWYETIHRKR